MSNVNSNKHTTLFQKKIILILFGIGVFFILLEIALRLGGFIFVAAQEYRNRESVRKNGQYRILCLGESTTALGGNDSYPSQLEEILNQKNIGIKFSVINKGIPGVSTDGILDRLPEFLNAYNPHMVIAMMGINDNTWNLAQVIKPYQELSSRGGTNILQSLRVYKVVHYLYTGIASKRIIKLSTHNNKENNIKPPAFKLNYSLPTAMLASEGDNYKRLGKFSEAESKYKQSLDSGVPSYDIYVSLGWSYECHDMPTEAIEAFRKAVEIDSSLNTAYYGLGHAYFYANNLNEAEKMYAKSIEIEPKDNRAYIGLGQCYVAQGRYGEAEAIYKKAIEVNNYDDRGPAALASLYEMLGNYSLVPKYRRLSNNIRLQYYVPMTRSNYLKLKEIVDKQGIQLVCVQYPMRSIESLKKIFNGKDGIIFVDNEKIFKDALKNASYKEYFWDMAGGDFGHCTRKGNRVLANNIARVIMKEYFKKY